MVSYTVLFFYRLGSEDLGGMLQFGLKHRAGWLVWGVGFKGNLLAGL